MRVIAGTAGGIRLEAPKSMARPSTDRLREALFSILQWRVAEARVLDLFAGSGALGIEALSRGAAHASFVDQDRAAVAAIERNLSKARLQERAQVAQGDVLRWVARSSATFDLVVADPPYVKSPADRDWAAALLEDAGPLATVVEPDGLVVIETGSPEAPRHGTSWTRSDVRSYGRSHLHFFEPAR